MILLHHRRQPGWAIGSLIALALVTAGCGYTLTGSGASSTIPEHVVDFAILPFENRTNRPEIEQRITEEVGSQLSRRRKYNVVSSADLADAVLSGAVTTYRTNAVQFGSTGRATRVEAVVQIQATLREVSTDEILWSQAGLVFREQFDVPDTGEFFDQETLALDDIARGAASTLVNSIFEGF